MNEFASRAWPSVVSVPAADPLPGWMVPSKPDALPSVPMVPGPLSRPPRPVTVRSALVTVAPLRASTPPVASSIVPLGAADSRLPDPMVSCIRSIVRVFESTLMSPFQVSCWRPVEPCSSSPACRVIDCAAPVVMLLVMVSFESSTTTSPSEPMPRAFARSTRAPLSRSWPVYEPCAKARLTSVGETSPAVLRIPRFPVPCTVPVSVRSPVIRPTFDVTSIVDTTPAALPTSRVPANVASRSSM